MRKIKRYAAFAVAAVMLLSMSGCGKEKTDADNSSEAVTTQEEVKGPAPAIEDNEDWSTTEEEVDTSGQFTTEEGVELLGFDFESGDISGFATYTNGGDFSISAKDGELVAKIKKTGKLDYANQLYYDGFAMAKDCVYTISFDVYSDVNCNIEWRIQLNGGDYHAYASDIIALSPEKQTITCEFSMDDESDPAPRLAFNMGSFEENGGELGEHNIYFDNLSLVITDSSKAQQISGAPTPIQVKVNQIGYACDDYKTVVTTSENDEKFKIVDIDTGDTVYIGEYGEVEYDATIGGKVRNGDFSDFKYTGNYQIISSPSGASYEFSIGNNLYDDVYKDVVLMLYRQRCGSELDADIAGDFAHAACHTDGAIVYGSASSSTVDVSGGWHDAGDYGRYVVPGAKTIQDLFLAYKDFNKKSDDIGIPESGNGIPDLLDEARYELDWMLKMQDGESGGVYHKVTAAVFPEVVLPPEETDQLILAPVSYTATADFAAVMAEASVIYEDIDKEFADRCLEASKKAFDYIEANKNISGYKNPDDIVTGEYPDDNISDERLWAASELYIATKDDSYLETVKELIAEGTSTGLGWADINGYALYDLASAKDIDENVNAQAKSIIIAAADSLINDCDDSPFYMGIGYIYPWGSNMSVANNGMLLLMANNLSPNESYAEYAQRHRDYLFGVNATGYCYVTGYGDLSPEHTHHRPSQVLNETMPGMLVGGPNSNLEDSYSAAVLNGFAPALCYVDNEQSYSCNEITIYWNSPLIYLMTGLQ
ncbi:MAG: glycoside hydrolase family 9 protein [Lachnospiraceae bacterium]|nr:glycoside hydrolase family 9 protein [Lachnospiraceae bacterium]